MLARYFIQAADGTVIAIENPGMRVAPPEVIERLARGEEVSSSLCHSGDAPRFRAAAGPHNWLRKRIFFARRPSPRQPDDRFFTMD